ncbi:MAG: RNA pseudouridine synthase [Candidatus Moranbacteria bacterium]|nr:RNA pseudouridine synthase [Candidatus Moranbacteria bacterium]
MLKIIFQNQDFIIVEKPAGLAVHGGAGMSEPTLVGFLVEKFPEIKNVGDNPAVRPGIVHRLDKETSGVMVVARNQKTFEYLKKLFADRKIEKKYLAVVHGKLKSKTGKIEGEMGRSKKDFRRQSLVRGKIHPVESRKAGLASPEFNRVNVRKARYSLTFYKTLRESGEKTLLEVSPKTGRMHQIRVHLQSIGHPVVGDKKYTFKQWKNDAAPRLMLHAVSLGFTSAHNEKYFFECLPPPEFQKI